MKRLFPALVFFQFVALSAAAQDMTIGYFKEWPLPALYGKSTGVFADALNGDVTWQAYPDSTKMRAALAKGDIDIALSLGTVPLLLAKMAGQDVKIIDITVDYSNNQGCVVRGDRNSPETLAGSRAALPVGTIVHFGLLRQLTTLGVDAATVEFRDMPPQRAFVAFEKGQADIACGWGETFARLKTKGTDMASLLPTPITPPYVFDSIVTTATFAQQNSDAVALFLDARNGLLEQFAKDPQAMLPAIAAQSGLTETAAKTTLQGFRFPPIGARLGDAWLGKGSGDSLVALAQFFTQQGTLEQIPEGLETLVDGRYLQMALALRTERENASPPEAPAQ